MTPPAPRVPLWAGIVGVLGLGVILILVYRLREVGWVEEIEPPVDSVARSFDDSSEALKQTVVLPTLDTPIPEGRSAIWCSSFQLAWNAFQKEVVKGPVRIQNAEAIADRLNEARESDADLPVEAFYAGAGLAADGVAERIRREMGQKFPDGPRPNLPATPGAAMAYAYLKAGVRYEHHFFNNTEPFSFTDASGKQNVVLSFGITDKQKNKDAAGDTFRGQVAVLWYEGADFAVDLCKTSQPNQIILARMSRQATLADMVRKLHAKLPAKEAGTGRMGQDDTLLVPAMHWRVEHRFRELEGPDRTLLHPTLPGLYLGLAAQVVEFKMDRYGAEVGSEAMVVYLNGGPKQYHFDRPFLICMKKRGSERPFFAMWVENGELLAPWQK